MSFRGRFGYDIPTQRRENASMLSFHLHSLPGAVWPEIPDGAFAQIWAMMLEVERTQWLSPEELLGGQLTQVRTLLTHCSQHVPYYQEQLRQANIRPDDIRTLEDFRRVPLLSRRTVQEQFRRLQATALPAGLKATSTLHTSGSSGMPIEVRQTNLVTMWWLVFHARDLSWCDLDLRGSFAGIRGFGATGAQQQLALNGLQFPTWDPRLARLFQIGPGFGMDIHQEPTRQLQWLLRVQPNYLLSYPPNLAHLAHLLAESGQRLSKLLTILAIGETLTDEARAVIEAGFGVPVKSTYSCVEAGYVASPCPEGHGLHVHSESVLLEVLDAAGQPCRPGETGRVVLTTLHNHLMPFVRYEILDEATVGPERCPCGRGLPLLTRVDGKTRPQFVLPDGRRKDSGFLVRHLRKLGGYQQHQIVQEAADRLIVRLVAGRDWNDANRASLVRAVHEYFEAAIHVDVQIVDRLEMTRAGKVREVVVNVNG